MPCPGDNLALIQTWTTTCLNKCLKCSQVLYRTRSSAKGQQHANISWQNRSYCLCPTCCFLSEWYVHKNMKLLIVNYFMLTISLPVELWEWWGIEGVLVHHDHWSPLSRLNESDAANAIITQNSPRGITNFVKDPVTKRFTSYHFCVIQLSNFDVETVSSVSI